MCINFSYKVENRMGGISVSIDVEIIDCVCDEVGWLVEMFILLFLVYYV